jgi:hypothetical protein
MVILLAGFLPDLKLETSIFHQPNTLWMVYKIGSCLSSVVNIRVPMN